MRFTILKRRKRKILKKEMEVHQKLSEKFKKGDNMFFGLGRKGKSKVVEGTIRKIFDNDGSTIIADGKESNKEDSQLEKKLEIFVIIALIFGVIISANFITDLLQFAINSNTAITYNSATIKILLNIFMWCCIGFTPFMFAVTIWLLIGRDEAVNYPIAKQV